MSDPGTATAWAPDERVVSMTAEVVRRRREGPYWALTLAAGRIAQLARPGQFVEVAVAAPGALLRRPFSIAAISRQGIAAGTIDIVFDAGGPGTDWLTGLEARDTVDVIGPLGTPFPLPKRPVACLLVGGGYGAAPLYALAEELVASRFRVDLLIGAASADRLLESMTAKRAAASVRVTTDDGSSGARGRVTDVLDEVLDACGTGVVYACGPNPMLAAVSARCAARGIPVQVALEERMACGIGVCATCAVPMHARDGSVRMVRACTDGPVLNGAKVDWPAFLSPWGVVDGPEEGVDADAERGAAEPEHPDAPTRDAAPPGRPGTGPRGGAR